MKRRLKKEIEKAKVCRNDKETKVELDMQDKMEAI